jgi:RND family efflux transporter MFP subunit
MESHFMSSTTDSSRPTPTLIHNRNFWYIIGSVLLVLIIVGGYLYYRSTQQKSKASTSGTSLQTATVRQGSIVINASGTGTVVAAATANLGFPNTGGSSNTGNGTLTQLNVIVGNQVKKGQLLAAEDNTNQAQALAQAKFNLAQLTSPAAIATAQGAVATDQVNVTNDYQNLEYYISPERVSWELKVATAQQNLTDAQLAAQASPSADATQKVQDAQKALDYANQQLLGAEDWYNTEYVPQHFTYLVKSTSSSGTTSGKSRGKTPPPTKVISPPNTTTVASARAALALAQATLVQDQDLVTALTTGVIPDTAAGTSLTALKQAQTALQTAQTNFNDTQIIAPIDGTVTAVNNQIGDTVGSATVITVSDLSRLLLTVYIDETDLSKLAIGEEADAVFDSLPNQTFKGKVTEIVPQLTTVASVPAVQAQVQLDNTTGTALYVGLNATVNVINAQANNVLLVPVQALKLLEPGKYAVFVVQNGNLTLQPVVVGLMDQSFAEIKSGLQSGDVVSTGLAATNQSASAATP